MVICLNMRVNIIVPKINKNININVEKDDKNIPDKIIKKPFSFVNFIKKCFCC